MSIECVICYEVLQSSQTVHHTPCGHVFHQTCLSKWFERSKTCPECRQNVEESKTGKIYLHYASNDSMQEITSSLQTEIANLNHELLIKEVEIIESNANNTKLSLLVKSKENEIRYLSEQLWMQKKLVEVEMAAHRATKSDLFRSMVEIFKLLKSDLLENREVWNKFLTFFRGISNHETIFKTLSDSQSESTSHGESSEGPEALISVLEQKIEPDTTPVSLSRQIPMRELDENRLGSEVADKFGPQQRLRGLETMLVNVFDRMEPRNSERVEPVRKKIKTNGTPVDVIDLTKEPVNPLVDLTDDDDVVS